MINHAVPQPCAWPVPWPDFAPYLQRVLDLLHHADDTGEPLPMPALEIARWEAQGYTVNLQTGVIEWEADCERERA